MESIGAVPRGPGSATHVDLEDMRRQILRWVLLGLPTASALLGFGYAADYSRLPFGPGLLIPVLVAAWLVGERLLQRRIALAASWTVASMFLMLVAAIQFCPGCSLEAFFSVVALVATATLGPLGGLLVAGGATVYLSAGIWVTGVSPSGGPAWTSIVLVWLSGALVWLIGRHLETALEWYQHSYTQELVKMEEVRRHRGELSRTLKSLNEAYDHLRRLNEELARARQVAEEARRLKAEFATNLSHELRTPLNLIIGFSELMVTAPHLYGDQPVSIPLSGALRRDLDAIHRNAQHLSSLLDDILDLGQIEAGKVGLYKERLPLADVAAEAAAVVEKLFEARGLGLTVTVPADLPSPYADRTRVRQILINLLNNAARFTDRGGVSIRAWASDSDVVVATEDTGIGIAPPDIPRVFEEFHQLGSPDRPAQGGRGLGLAICRHLVELHGGSIWAESEVGRGTTFFFSLPIHEAVVPLTEAATRHRWLRAAQSGDTEARTVVAVAEDPAIQRLFARHLGGYRVVGVPTWEQACELASADPVRAFVVATATPRECLAAVERLPERGYQAPVAICSLPTRQALAQRLGAAAYLTKPVSRAQVEEVLSSLGLRIRRVLVVDDDPEMARLLADMIRSFGRGHRVGLASGGAEALALLRERRYDVVLLDIRMPDIDGQTVLQQMRADEKLRKIPVVVVTAMFGQDAVPNAGTLAITRWPGLSAEELTRCLQASLDSLIETAPSTAGALPATPAGSPAWSETPPLPAAAPGRAV